jgi:hypothetical protein
VSDQLEPDLERVARMLAEAGPLPDAPATLRARALAIPDGGPVAAADVAAAARRRRRRPRPIALAGLAAAVAAIAIVPAIVLIRDDDGSRHIDLTPRSFAPQSSGTADVAAHGDGSTTIELEVKGLPRPSPGRTYEAWLGRKGDRLALGTFQTNSHGWANVSWKVTRDEMHGYRWLWVTSEPAGGSTSPSEDTALWGPLT